MKYPLKFYTLSLFHEKFITLYLSPTPTNEAVTNTIGQAPLFPKLSYAHLLHVETRKKGLSGQEKVDNTDSEGGIFTTLVWSDTRGINLLVIIKSFGQ